MRKLPLFFGLIFFLSMTSSQLTLAQISESPDSAIQALENEYMQAYDSLGVPELAVRDYRDYLAAIPPAETREAQRKNFSQFQNKLFQINPALLSHEAQLGYEQLRFEFEINLERIALESSYAAKWGDKAPPEGGLFQLPDHERWYRFFLHLVAAKDFSPEQLSSLGESEVNRIRSEMLKIQKKLGFEGQDENFYRHLQDESFFIRDERLVKEGYLAIYKRAADGLAQAFSRTNVPPLKVEPIANPNKDTPPGYYDEASSTFFFNFFGQKHNRRTMDIFFIHEAIPGHHYQISLANELTLPLSKLWYQSFSEGWAAYTENLGLQMGLYSDLYSEYGKWEWDLVRSARLVLDVGINFRGWSKEEALRYWMGHVPNQDSIAIREIDRIMRWPVQVASYKVGENEILRLRALMQKQQGSAFNIKNFHARILSHGSVPLSVLPKAVGLSEN